MTTTDVPVTLRTGTATLDDGIEFGRYVNEASGNLYRMMLGSPARDIVARAYVEPDHDLSYQFVIFAVQGGEIVGMGSGYTAEAAARFRHGVLSDMTGPIRRARLRLLERMSGRLIQFLETIPEGDFYVRALAVDEDHRGLGIGTRLLAALEDTARGAGSARLVLDVAAKNRKARRLYQRFGMAYEKESQRWFGLPKHQCHPDGQDLVTDGHRVSHFSTSSR